MFDWTRVDNVDRCSNLSLEEFIEKYERPNKPVIFDSYFLICKLDIGHYHGHHSKVKEGNIHLSLTSLQKKMASSQSMDARKAYSKLWRYSL